MCNLQFNGISLLSGLCDMEYVGYTNRDLRQCITEHCSFNSTFGKHAQEKHRMLKSVSVFIVISLLDNDV